MYKERKLKNGQMIVAFENETSLTEVLLQIDSYVQNFPHLKIVAMSHAYVRREISGNYTAVVTFEPAGEEDA